jgi:4-amino-4-deoxy-L-arabinose transferase-like glycosyltransferase
MEEAAPAPARSRALLRHPLTWLAVLTALGAALRFLLLDRPELWLDEAAVFRRTCGSFKELVDELAKTGFTPLHYVLYWAIQQFATMTPYVMRTPTGVAGALMVPVMYWLAVELGTSRRTALVAALLTACSAYMLNYSRDAKMYVPCWMLGALSTACLLWWLRTRSRRAWWCWVIAGLGMLGFHATGTIVLAIHVIVYLTSARLHWKSAIYFAAGLAIIVTPIAVYYQAFNRYPQRVSKSWSESGLAWIEWVNSRRDGPSLLMCTTTHFLWAWEWPPPQGDPEVNPRLLFAGKASTIAMLAVVALGLLPWRRSKTEPVAVPWRALLWIGAWLVLPIYGIYCASVDRAAAPWQWPTLIWHHSPYAVGLGAAVLVGSLLFPGGRDWRKRLLDLAILAGVALALLGLCAAVYLVTPTQRGSVWMPRYVGVAWPALAIAMAVLVMRLPTAPLRIAALSLIVSANLVQYAVRVFVRVEPPTPIMAKDILDSARDRLHSRTYYGLRNPHLFGHSNQFVSPSGQYYLFILSGEPVTPRTFNAQYDKLFPFFKPFPMLRMAVAMGVSQSPDLRRIVIWDEVEPDAEQPDKDELLGALGSGWHRVAQEHFSHIDRWTWARRPGTRRSVYEKK